jgi:hypothetical protein
VQRAERELAAALASHGARVKVVRIPSGEPDATENAGKMGVDDFLKAKGREEFQKLLDAAEMPKPPEPGEFLEAASEMDPAIEAEHFLATFKVTGLPALRYWAEAWHQWSGGRYIEARPAEVRAAVVNHLNKRYMGVHARHVSDLLEQLRAKAILPGNVEPPAWLESPPGNWPAGECLPTRNAVVHLPSLVEGTVRGQGGGDGRRKRTLRSIRGVVQGAGSRPRRDHAIVWSRPEGGRTSNPYIAATRRR